MRTTDRERYIRQLNIAVVSLRYAQTGWWRNYWYHVGIDAMAKVRYYDAHD